MRICVLYTTAVFYLGLLYNAESCNVEIVANASPTNITSPGYPNGEYPNELNCWWKVDAANNANNVAVEVVDSALETSRNCTYDSLTFYDGLDTSAPRIASICGTQRGAYISTSSSIYIQFKSDSSVGYRGFFLKIYEIPKCGGELTATSEWTVLLSPGYPDEYFNNMRCTWLITAESENDTVVLDVINSNIEENHNCIYDSVTVYNGNASDLADTLGTYCGSISPSFQSSKDQLSIVFITDSSLVKSGFKMLYQSVEADHCNRTMLVDYHTLFFVSPGYPDGVYNDMMCVWTIVSPSLQNVYLQALTSNIEDSEECANESVTVYSGSMTRELGAYCGNNTPYYVSDTYIMTVVFQTGDTASGQGFRMGFMSTPYSGLPHTIIPGTVTDSPYCGSTSLTAVSYPQYLQSPGYPVAYRNHEECIWTIRAVSISKMVRVIVEDFQLEPYCADFVRVYDGSSILSPWIQSWCGDMKSTVQSSQQFLTLLLKTDSSGVYRGFSIKYFETSEHFSCGGSLLADSTATLLTSPGYPGNQMTNLNCVWTIHTIYSQIKIKAIQTDLEQCHSCGCDYVQINDGSSTSHTMLGKYCGTHEPTFYSSGQYVTITYHTNGHKTYRGFKLEYTGGRFSPCALQELTASVINDDFTSPNYPFDYPSNADCTWRIYTYDPDYVVSISVITSDIEDSADCDFDYVEAFDGYDSTATSLGRWCGTYMPDKHSSGEYMFIKFHTDSSNTDTGFKISYESKLKDSFPGLDPTNVGAIVGGTTGGIVFIVVACVLIAACNKKSPRPVVTRVQDSSTASGNVITLGQRSLETSVTPAAFQPPPPYCQVATGEQRRTVGTGGNPAHSPPYPNNGVTSDTAPVVNQQKY